MPYGVEVFVESKPVVSGLSPANIFHSMKITNQNAGTYNYPIPASTDSGSLIVVTGKVTSDHTTYSQGGIGKAYISELTVTATNVKVVMTAIPDPNIVSLPLYLNFFKWRP